MNLLVWIIIGVGLALSFVIGFWELFTPSHPNPAFQISSNDTIIPTAKGLADVEKISIVFPTRLPIMIWYQWWIW